MFENGHFIKPNAEFKQNYSGQNYAPMFRRKFHIEKKGRATLSVCGLGIAYYFLNGKPISEDLFTAPVSDYNKILWYNKYDVTDMLAEGTNIFSVICGNGWYNEDFKTVWNFNEAEWRDVPKFILQLDIDGETVLKSDSEWNCTVDGPVVYNNLRNGEIFDFNRYDKHWKAADYDDSAWDGAEIDQTPPRGRFVECLCEPIREIAAYAAKKSVRTADNAFVFDIGKTKSAKRRCDTKMS